VSRGGIGGGRIEARQLGQLKRPLQDLEESPNDYRRS